MNFCKQQGICNFLNCNISTVYLHVKLQNGNDYNYKHAKKSHFLLSFFQNFTCFKMQKKKTKMFDIEKSF